MGLSNAIHQAKSRKLETPQRVEVVKGKHSSLLGISLMVPSGCYKCQHCGREYGGYSGLLSHIEACHDMVRYICSTCGVSLRSRDAIRKHLKNVHKLCGITADMYQRTTVKQAGMKQPAVNNQPAVKQAAVKQAAVKPCPVPMFNSEGPGSVVRMNLRKPAPPRTERAAEGCGNMQEHVSTVQVKQEPTDSTTEEVAPAENTSTTSASGNFTELSPLQCDICWKILSTKAILHKHKLSHTKPIKCEICGHRFRDKHDLQKHASVHEYHPSEQACGAEQQQPGYKVSEAQGSSSPSKLHGFACILCKATYMNKGALKKHLAKAHDQDMHEALYTKMQVGKQTAVSTEGIKQEPLDVWDDIEDGELAQKASKPAPEARKPAQKASKPALGARKPAQKASKPALGASKPALEANNPVQGASMSAPEVSMSARDKVSDNSSEKNKCRCDVCGQIMSNITRFYKHQLIHTKPQKCLECGRRFRDKSHLTQHKCTGIQAEGFMCLVCEESFELCMDLDRHMSEQHGGVELKCMFCASAAFTRVTMLDRHLWRAHKRSISNKNTYAYSVAQSTSSQHNVPKSEDVPV